MEKSGGVPRAARIPEGDRRRVGDVAANILGVLLASVGMLGALVIWHLVRRGRLLQARGAPRRVVLPLEEPERVKSEGDAEAEG